MTATLLISALGLSACGSNVPEPTEAAEQLAAHLSSPELEALQETTLADSSVDPASLADATAGLSPYAVSVSLKNAVIDEDTDSQHTTATADYVVTWDLSGDGESEDSEGESNEWSYDTQATLIWNEAIESWEPELTPETLVPGLADGGRVAVAVDRADRGEILDTRDEPLATDRPVQRLGIDKSHLLDALATDGNEPSEAEVTEAITDSATALAELLELDPATFVDRTMTAGERAWVEFIVLRDDGETDIPFNDVGEIPGAVAREDTMVLGPTRSFARSLLGTFGEPNAEQIEDSDDELAAGVPTGLSGLQRTYNAELAGTDGLEITVDNSAATADALPTSEPVGFSREVVDGNSITATLDARVQHLAEDTIGESDVLAGLVVVRPSDGHILAAADGPEDTSWPLAMTGAYPPGSTFKIVTALAMLRNGMTPESTVSCPQSIEIDGTQISNFDEYPSSFLGDITLAEAIAQSCNTVFVGQWEDITPEQEHDAAVALGLVADPVVGFDGAFLGSVPTDVEGAQHAAGLFGQGVVEASPLGMATVAASVAAGTTVSPILISDPVVDPYQNDHLPGNTPLTEDEAAALRSLMAGPVQSGTVPVLQDVPGEPVLAKTGTAQFVEEGETLAHTWIMASHGDLAVSLFFHEGLAGAQTNGPVLQEFLTQLDGISLGE